MDEDRIAGAARRAKDAVAESAGRLIHNTELAAAGKAERAAQGGSHGCGI